MKAKCLEIIQLRLAGKHRASLIEDIRRSLAGSEADGVRLYFSANVPTDLSVHIYSKTHKGKLRISDLGVRLAAALREYGMVQHTLWIADRGTVQKLRHASGNVRSKG